MRHNLDTEIPSNYKIEVQDHDGLWSTTGFLVVYGGSGSWISSIYGTPFPTGTADLVNSYLHTAALIGT